MTADDLAKCHVREILHGHGLKGMYVYRHVVVEHPRAVREQRKEARGKPEVTTWFVDGKALPPGNDLAAVAEALRQPHDLAGIADRLIAASFGTVSATYADGRITAVNPRGNKLSGLHPDFEGVPIDWQEPTP